MNLQRLARCSSLLRQTRVLGILQPFQQDAILSRAVATDFSEEGDLQSTISRVHGARLSFKSPSGVSRTKQSVNMAKGLGVEVEEVDSSVEGQKLFNFRGKGQGQGPACQSKEAVENNPRDVFKASHERQIQQQGSQAAFPLHSAQDKYGKRAKGVAKPVTFQQKPQAQGERLSEDKYKHTQDIISEAAKVPAPATSPEEDCEMTVGRYQAMKQAAASSLHRGSRSLSSTQTSAQQYGHEAQIAVERAFAMGKEALDQSFQALKDIASQIKQGQQPPMTGEAEAQSPGASKASGAEEPEDGSGNSGSAPPVGPGGKGSTRKKSEEAAHEKERDMASY